MDFIEDKLLKNFLIALVVISILFFIGITTYLIKGSSSDSFCNVASNEAISDLDYKILGDEIVNNDVVLQSIDLNNKEFSYYNAYDFCVNGVVSADTSLKLSVYDENNKLIGSNYFSNDSGLFCVAVDKSFSLKNNFVGLKCDNCDVVSNNFTPLVSVGTDTVSIVNGVSVISDQRDYVIKGYVDCDYLSFRLFKYFLLTLALFGLVFLLMLGVEYIKKVAFSGW